jgi:probable addiction module antidote protein
MSALDTGSTSSAGNLPSSSCSADGDKSTQGKDIIRARTMAADLDQERTMPLQLTEFDASAYLDSEEVIAEYLTAALEDGDPDVFLAAIGNVAKARGMTQIAQATGLGRESLYKALAPGARPKYDTVLKVLRSLGVRLAVSASGAT